MLCHCSNNQNHRLNKYRKDHRNFDLSSPFNCY